MIKVPDIQRERERDKEREHRSYHSLQSVEFSKDFLKQSTLHQYQDAEITVGLKIRHDVQ